MRPVPCGRCRRIIGVDCECKIPLLPASTGCAGKQSYTSRLAAESGLARRKAQWIHDQRFVVKRRHHAQPPEQIYLCPKCSTWHLTSTPKREGAQ